MIVMGIDPSSRKLVAVSSRGPKSSFRIDTRKLSEDHVLGAGQAYEWMDQISGEIIDGLDDDLCVYLEAPVLGVGGPRATITQSQIGGALMAALSRRRVPVTMVNNQSWKKRVCGRGNIDKKEVAARMASIWPDLVKEANGDQDVVDAGAINLFGWHVVKLRSRLTRGRR